MLVDTAKIEQVLNNFISNAIKFSHPQNVVEIRLNKTGDQFIISVADDGQGIPEEELNRNGVSP